MYMGSDKKWNNNQGWAKKKRIRRIEPNLIQKNSSEPEPKLIKYPNGFKILVSKEPKPNPIRKSSSEPEPKLIKYPNGFKILVSREPKPNPIRTKLFQVPENIRNRFIYLNILIIFRFNVYLKPSKIYKIFLYCLKYLKIYTNSQK